METTVVYKIVRLVGSERLSFAAGVWDVTYKPRVWASGVDGTPLFVFKTLAAVREYAKGSRSWCKAEIWKAEAKKVRPIRRKLLGPSMMWPRYWAGKLEGKVEAPEGTLLADQVKLTQRVWPED